MKNAGLIFLALMASLARSAAMKAPIPLPTRALPQLTQQGAPIISAEFKKDATAFKRSLALLQSANATCARMLQPRFKTCGYCIKQKCSARVRSVCKKEESHDILGSIVGLAVHGIPNFFSKSIPHFVVNTVGKNVIKVGENIGKFIKNGVTRRITDGFDKGIDGIEDIGKTIGGGITGIGKDIGSGIIDFGQTLGDGILGIGQGAIDGIKDIGSTIGDALKDSFGEIKDFFKWGKRRRRSEPSCADFNRDANKACLHYVKACKACDINPQRDCPTLAAAASKFKKVTIQAAWIQHFKEPDFSVNSVTYDAMTVDPTTGGFKSVQVSVTFFGRKDTFLLNKPVQPFDAVKTGPVIAKMAMDRFKAATKP